MTTRGRPIRNVHNAPAHLRTSGMPLANRHRVVRKRDNKHTDTHREGRPHRLNRQLTPKPTAPRSTPLHCNGAPCCRAAQAQPPPPPRWHAYGHRPPYMRDSMRSLSHTIAMGCFRIPGNCLWPQAATQETQGIGEPAPTLAPAIDPESAPPPPPAPKGAPKAPLAPPLPPPVSSPRAGPPDHCRTVFLWFRLCVCGFVWFFVVAGVVSSVFLWSPEWSRRFFVVDGVVSSGFLGR